MKVNVFHVCLYKVVKQNANFRSQKAKISKWIIESLLIVITINIDSFWCLREYSLGTFIQCVIHMNVRWSSLRKTLFTPKQYPSIGLSIGFVESRSTGCILFWIYNSQGSHHHHIHHARGVPNSVYSRNGKKFFPFFLSVGVVVE